MSIALRCDIALNRLGQQPVAIKKIRGVGQITIPTCEMMELATLYRMRLTNGRLECPLAALNHGNY